MDWNNEATVHIYVHIRICSKCKLMEMQHLLAVIMVPKLFSHTYNKIQDYYMY